MSTAGMQPTPQHRRSHQEVAHVERHGWLYAGIAIVVIALLAWGIAVYRQGTTNTESLQKADQLISALTAANLPVPTDRDTIARTLGTDGGPVCDDPAGTLTKALYNDSLGNGASTIGMRPIVANTNQILASEVVVLNTYCPSNVTKVASFIANLKNADVVRS